LAALPVEVALQFIARLMRIGETLSPVSNADRRPTALTLIGTPPHLHRDWVPPPMCTETRLAPAASAPGPGSPHLHRDSRGYRRRRLTLSSSHSSRRA
jgi:hypothetical protein